MCSFEESQVLRHFKKIVQAIDFKVRAYLHHAAASAMANSLSMQRSELAEAAEAFAACGDISLIHPFLGQSESDDA